MVEPTSTYLYVDADLNSIFVQGSQLIDRGPWSSSETYTPPDVIQIGADYYYCLATNTNMPPSGIVDENWSTLVVVEEGAGTNVVNAGSDYYARTLAELALETAWVGTQIGSSAYNLAQAAYDIAVIGTNLGSSAYNYAQAAYDLAVIGTNNPGGFAVGTDAYALAESGTSIAWSAYYLAQIGTNTGTAALNSAASARSVADAAFNIAVMGTDAAANANAYASIAWQLAQFGTNTGTEALNRADSARSVADSAFTIAVIGTNTGTAAYQLATSGSNLAYQAYLLATGGTIAGVDNTARSIATAAYGIAQIGTNTGTAAYQLAQSGSSVAQAAYVLAQLGTIIPPLSSLPDVSIPAPTASQVLVFDGSLWIAGDAPSTISPSAFTYYTDNTASGTLSYFNLTTSPSGQPEHIASLSVGATTPFVPARSFITPALNRTLISAGAWQFNTYATTSLAQRPYQIVTDVFLRTVGGVQTHLFSGTSDAVISINPQQQTSFITQGSFACNTTDRLVFGYAALRVGAVTTATVYSAGTAHDSNIVTPIGYAHNDLEGLQGGSAGQYYHVTLNQSGALAGTSGTPSASNPYVTQASLVIEQGTRSQADQALANLITAEAGTRATADQNLQNQVTILQQQLGVDFSGTISMYTSLVRYGKPDTAWIVVEGVVVSQTESKFIWDDFESYGTTTGTNAVTGMDDGSSWNGFGSIFTNGLWVGVNGTDWMNLYPTGTITSSTLNNGTGWSSAGTSYVYGYYFHFLGTDTFEQYGTGTLSSSGTEINAGGGWVGTALCYTGSNRP